MFDGIVFPEWTGENCGKTRAALGKILKRAPWEFRSDYLERILLNRIVGFENTQFREIVEASLRPLLTGPSAAAEIIELLISEKILVPENVGVVAKADLLQIDGTSSSEFVTLKGQSVVPKAIGELYSRLPRTIATAALITTLSEHLKRSGATKDIQKSAAQISNFLIMNGLLEPAVENESAGHAVHRSAFYLNCESSRPHRETIIEKLDDVTFLPLSSVTMMAPVSHEEVVKALEIISILPRRDFDELTCVLKLTPGTDPKWSGILLEEARDRDFIRSAAIITKFPPPPAEDFIRLDAQHVLHVNDAADFNRALELTERGMTPKVSITSEKLFLDLLDSAASGAPSASVVLLDNWISLRKCRRRSSHHFTSSKVCAECPIHGAWSKDAAWKPARISGPVSTRIIRLQSCI